MINLKHNIKFLNYIFLEDTDIMNFIKFLLAFSISTFIIADDRIKYNEIAQSESNEQKTKNTNDEETENTSLEDAAADFSGPIDFKDEYLLSLSFGSTIPFGKNLKESYTGGMNLKFNVLTPFGFSMLGKDFKLLAGLDILKCTASEGKTYGDYNVTSFGAKLVTNISIIDIAIGSGLASSSGTSYISDNGVFPEYSMTTAYISGGLYYKLPLDKLFQKVDMGNLNFDISNLSISLYTEGIEIFGAPAEEGTSDLISVGASLAYPILF